ncbi:MAG: peptidoglycan DD-metalloendopeptidase family protein [bacterium]
MKMIYGMKVFCFFALAFLISSPLSLLQGAATKDPKKSSSAPVQKTAPVKAGPKTTPKAKKPQPAKSLPAKKVKPAAKPGGLYHTVKKGQTLFGISRTYHVSIEELAKANRLSKPSALKVGQRLFIPRARQAKRVEPFKPLSSKQRVEIVRSLETTDIEEGDLSEGEGPPGEDSEATTAEDLPKEPEEPPGSPSDSSPAEVAKAESEGFIWPLINRITSRFGPRGRGMHTGVDIAAPSYHGVVAAADGEVILVQHSRRGLGNAVVLQHDHGYTTVYGHGVVILVQEGDTVKRGEPILGVGNTGHSTGNHLHFEIRRNGVPTDPLPLMPPTLDELIEGLRAEKS